MTEDEKEILKHLVQAYNKFLKLPVLHTSDPYEFRFNIHCLQNILMSRVAIRNEPDLFFKMNQDEPKATGG